ncbi:hypothetical protein [Anaerosporobacter sp.]|uniref:hypothetical protein n=1 Tax=Anaerosporobacter sp. TaxID=1872529 RepID=UPI00286EC0FB|nr:hypothetical protein [Anaerosporobacter sp.]
MKVKEKLEVANNLAIKSEYESFYRFAVNYLLSKQNEKREKEPQKEFFAFLEKIKKLKNTEDAIEIKTIYVMMGKVGDAEYPLKEWCKSILDNQQIRDIETEDLCYIMGSAARLCKINK